jgi:hypothetical protein
MQDTPVKKSMSASAAFSPTILDDSGVKSKKSTVRANPVKRAVVGEKAPAVTKNTRNGKRSPAKKLPSSKKARTSQILREILANNPEVEDFTVERIVNSIGETSFGTSLMFFAIPEVVPIPVPGLAAIVVIPTAVISGQMAVGHKQIRLPKFILKKTVPRKALAAAIRTILPILEKVEKVSKPRWKWATTPVARRLLGLFIFILALSIALPMPGFNMPQAISTFIIALGLVEDDGILVAAGVLGGLASLALLGGVVFGLFSFLGFGFGRP